VQDPKGPNPAPPAVSVIVRTKDRPGLLREALESLAAQTFRDFEAVVVNDSDTPLQAGDLESSGRGLALRLRLVSPGPPHGRARAANAGVEAATGTWIAYLDDDDLFLPDHLETLVGALEGQDRFHAAFTEALLVHQVRDADGTYREVSRETIFDVPYDPDRLVFSNTIPLLCLLHRRSLFLEAGRFDEAFDLYEDWDFLIRLSRLTTFQRVEKVTTLYRTRNDETNVTSASPWRGEVSERAREALFRKHWALHTPRAEMALLNLHEDEVAALARREGAVRETLTHLEQESRKDREHLVEQGRFLDEQRRLLGEQRRLLDEQVQRLDDQKRLLEEAESALAGERERSAQDRERHETERAELSAALDRLREERDRLDATVVQITGSLAWRLLTPWWKLRAFLAKG
jgi:glycosyltransferase involved in cell wall biosynthesis